ncbi:MAG TPA: hypothetical protein VEQ61_10360 [Thermoleophilaceae bacterium]|nr:hypothetical protein [Thermoleophilaceae bacterium]
MLAYAQTGHRNLPFVDEHALATRMSPERAWEALLHSAPSLGFTVTESTAPRRLVLEGRHPFSRYALVFLIDPAGDGGSVLRAQTSAAFPGLAGTAYRALVVGSGAHAIVVRRMLRRMAAGSG